jgi:hypothetical protein
MATSASDLQGTIARVAAMMVPAYSHVLGVGVESQAIESLLPDGCAFAAADILPAETQADIVVMLAAADMAATNLAAATRQLQRPFVGVWRLANSAEAALATLRSALEEAGIRLQCAQPVSSSLAVIKCAPEPELESRGSSFGGRRALVMSYYNHANFGDRLGYHILNGLMPADAEVTYGSLYPWNVPEGDYDLLVLGIGNSLLAKDACLPELSRLMEGIPRAIGIFGTQFREQFQRPDAAAALEAILGRLVTWWARYEEDMLAFGRGRDNVRHLGDWLIAAFPMAAPRLDKGLAIPPEIISQEKPLDRMIQEIQSYRAVSSARLHTLLCALASADHVSFQEQRESGDPLRTSGKFRSMLYDIFGRTFEEGELFAVDRDAVIGYKRKVEANLGALRSQLRELLGAFSVS